MKKLLPILLSVFFLFAPLTVFAQTDDGLDTASSDTATSDEDSAAASDDTVSTDNDSTGTSDTLDLTSDDSAGSPTAISEILESDTNTTGTEEKTITDYLPYILLAGAFILLVSIVAIIFSGREKKEKKVEEPVQESAPVAPTENLGSPPTNMDNISDSLYTPQANEEPVAEEQSTTSENIAPDLQTLVNQVGAEEQKTEEAPNMDNLVNETPVTESPVGTNVTADLQSLTSPDDNYEDTTTTETLDQPVQPADIFNSQPAISPVENTSATAEAPLTETPTLGNSMYTPALNTEPGNETPVADVSAENVFNSTPQVTTTPDTIQNEIPTTPLDQPIVDAFPVANEEVSLPDQPLINTTPEETPTAPDTTEETISTPTDDSGIPPVPPLM